MLSVMLLTACTVAPPMVAAPISDNTMYPTPLIPICVPAINRVCRDPNATGFRWMIQ